MVQSISKLIFGGLVAGFLATVLSLILAYVIGFLGIFISVRELFPTLLAGFTVLPIMVLLVLLPLSLFIGMSTGLVLAFVTHLQKRSVGPWLAALISLVLAELMLSGLAPLIFGTQSTDFVDIIGNPLVSGCYGLLLGGITGLQFRRMAQS